MYIPILSAQKTAQGISGKTFQKYQDFVSEKDPSEGTVLDQKHRLC